MRRRPDDRHEILFAPEALDRLAAGFDHLAALIALTLGPTRAAVLNARPGGSVELLSDAGTIARRVVEIPGRGQNTGAMILRHLAWRMHDQYGDGAATAAVLAREMVRAAVKRSPPWRPRLSRPPVRRC
jgi:chaperonin GroEL